MKKFLTILIALIISASFFVFPVFAQEPTDAPSESVSDDVVTDTTESITHPSEITPESEEKAFTKELVDALTNGANWAKFGGILAAVLGALAVLYKYTSGIKNVINGVKDLVAGKASKEDTEKLLKSESEKILSATLSALEDTKKKQEELTEKYNEQTAILTLITLQLVKSPYARTEIMNIITSAKAKGKDVAEIVEVIEAEIKAAEEAEEKMPTPALDSIVASVDTEETDGENGVALG
ncbi:MAG: hypothetical protein IKL79_01325 [Clostridia bacterium]|nr:hypothetical protein [Clostridia bacterium]